MGFHPLAFKDTGRGSEPSTEGWSAFGHLCGSCVLAPLLVLMVLVSFVTSPALDSVWHLSINSGTLQPCQDRLLKSNETPPTSKQIRRDGKKDSNFKVLVCLLAPGSFFFCVFEFSSEATDPGNFLV